MRTFTLLTSSAVLLGLSAGCVTLGTYEALEKAYILQRQHTQSTQATNDRIQTQNEGLILQKDALEALLKKRESELDIASVQLSSARDGWDRKLNAERDGWRLERL